MEVEKQSKITLLDVLDRRNDDRLVHTVYRKPMHTDIYLHNNSKHHLSRKQGILETLVEHSRRICETENMTTELEHLSTALQANGYTRNQLNR